ncbi:MAG: S16 family serine protease, partial [Halobacteriota archaeon]
MLALEQVDDSNSYTGALSNVSVYTQSGTGHVFVETKPLTGVDFQETARDAVTVAAQRAHVNLDQRDFEFVVNVSKGVDAVDGPSAGLPMTIAAYSAIVKKPTNQSVYSTGSIESDGTVSNVGGVYWKAQAAAKSGARVIIVPYNETVVS